MKHPMEPVYAEYNPGPPENQIPPEMGQYDLFGAVQVEFGYTNLIRISSLMQWNMGIQYTSNYSLGMDLEEYIKIRSCWPI